MDDDASSGFKTDILKISNIDLSMEGEFSINQLTLVNASMQFLSVNGVSGKTSSPKLVEFNGIVFTDTTLSSSNEFMKFGPIITSQDVQFIIRDFTAKDMVFLKGANILDAHFQAPNPILIENSVFSNIVGGYVELYPVSTSSNTNHASMILHNVTVENCDFYQHTFFILGGHSHLQMNSCNMRRNSAYFRGTVLSILGSDSSATFSNCVFNNNNGIEGGLFYVTSTSVISVENSTLYDNF